MNEEQIDELEELTRQFYYTRKKSIENDWYEKINEWYKGVKEDGEIIT